MRTVVSRANDLERSTFQARPCYRYIRQSDKLPTYDELPETGAVAKVKLFNPTGSGSWYIAAYDPDSRVAYGVTDLFERELGSFSMEELVDFRGRFGLPIERDLYFEPTPLSKILAGEIR